MTYLKWRDSDVHIYKNTSEPVEVPQGQIVAVIIMGHDRKYG